MPKWFKSTSDSESDDSSTDSSTTTISSEKSLDISKWLKGAKDDSSDDSVRDMVVSREQKRYNYINKIVSNVSTGLNENNWSLIHKNILLAKDHIKKDKEITTEFIQIVNSIQEAVLDNYVEYKNTITEDSLDQFNQSIKIVKQLIEEYSYTINLYNNKSISNISLVTSILSEEEVLKQDIQNIISSKASITEIGMIADRAKDYIDLYIQVLSIYITKYLETRHLSFLECETVYDNISNVLNLLKETPEVIIKEPASDLEEYTAIFHITLSYVVHRLNEHYKYLLQNTEVMTSEYDQLQSWEIKLVKLCNKVYEYYNSIKKCTGKHNKIAGVLNCILDLSYHNKPYNPRLLKYQKLIQKYSKDTDVISKSILYSGLHLIINKKYDDAIMLVRSTHRTVEDDYYIYTPELSILYNQFLARVGIVALEQRRIEDSFIALSELCQHRNLDILLGQVPYERQYQLLVPFHKHVDITITIECYLICCLLIDITPLPLPFSKLYSSINYKYDKEGVFGNPTRLEEIIYLASKNIKTGKWQEGYNLLDKIPSFIHVRDKVSKLIKVKSLEGYVDTYSKYFESFDKLSLERDFQLSSNIVDGILHKKTVV